jgi:SAM-dependent methyltransferase
MPEPCLLCGSRAFETLVRAGVDYEYGVEGATDVVRCRGCGLAVQDPRPRQSALAAYYPEEYANYAEPGSRITRALIRLTELLDARQTIRLIGRTGRILDVGCADGHYLDAIAGHGQWELHGTDISAAAVAHAGSKGHRVHAGALEDLDLGRDVFSLVRMNHLIEHVVDPFATLDKARELLRPGGWLVGETPNIACPDFRLLKRYWGALHLPRHIFFFDPRTLRVALARAGFTEVRISFTLMTTGWALGVQNYLQSRRRRSLRHGRIAGYPLLLVGFVPVLLAQKAARASTMMRFTARKPSGG